VSGELSLHATTPRESLARKTPSLSFQPGIRIGGYTILSPLGSGGMSRVFLAEDASLARKVALKILPPEDADEEGRARFLREAQALARVQHKNVVQVFASGVDEDIAWMALEYVVGDPLGALVDAGAVDEETALTLCAQAARGLAAVHEVGVVHRDVKPDNLLLDDNATVRVLDFGVALFVDAGRGGFVTQKGVAVGTPHFMAPEQARGSVIDARADAWGLGATLYSLLVGRPPFYEKDDEPDLDILARVLRERAPDVRARKPGVSAATAQIVARMLEPDVEKRLADMVAIAAALDGIADALAAGEDPGGVAAVPTVDAEKSSSGTAAPPATSAEPAPPAATASSTGPMSTVLAVSLALSFAGLGAVVALQLGDKPPPPPPVVEVKPPPPPPVEVKPPPPVTLPAAPEPPPVVEEEVEGPPTPEALEARILAAPQDRAALRELVGRDDVDAQEAVKRLAAAPREPGDNVVDTIAAIGARAHIEALRVALFSTSRSRALKAIDVLKELRPYEALAFFDEAARKHRDKIVQAKASEARRELFHVEQ
jgi:serine/threonine-protein kinase